jgi:hypothetical protein
MKFEDLKNEQFQRYDNEMYNTSEEHKNLLGLLNKIESLSAAAQAEFVKCWSFDYALNGQVYLGSKKTATAKFPNLSTEAPAAGIELVTWMDFPRTP